MHMYQKNILDNLRQAHSMRYSELRPAEVESSHFKYHLNQLIKDGFVEQKSRGVYALTVSGKSMVDRLSNDKVNPIATPKVITYTLLYDDTYYYLQRKQKEPYAGLVNMIGGKVHVGETTLNAAKREVHEKTTYRPNNLKLQTIAEVRISQNSELLSHAIAYVYSADVTGDAVLLQDCIKFPASKVADCQDIAPDFLSIIGGLNSMNTVSAISIDIDVVQ